MKGFLKNSFYVFVGLLGFKALPAEAAQQVYLCMNGIEGESTEKLHVGCIDVLAWSWGMSQSGTTHVGAGGGTGKASFQDLSVTKYIDKATTDLMLKTANGKHIPDATLEVWEYCCDTPYNMLTISMDDLIVTSVSTGGSNGESRFTENVTLNFAKFKVEYTPSDKSPTKEMGWDIVGNVEQ